MHDHALYLTRNCQSQMSIPLSISLVTTPSCFLFFSLRVQYKEAEECEKWGRPGSTYHVNDVQWMQGVPSTRNRAHTMWELTCAKLGRNAPFNADQGLSTASYGSHYYAFHHSTSFANARQ